MADNKASTKAMAKSVVYKELATKTGLQAKQVSAVFDALGDLIKGQLGKKGPGLFVIPNLIKLKLVMKPATKATTSTSCTTSPRSPSRPWRRSTRS